MSNYNTDAEPDDMQLARDGNFYSLGQREAAKILREDEQLRLDTLRNEGKLSAYTELQQRAEELARQRHSEDVAAVAEELAGDETYAKQPAFDQYATWKQRLESRSESRREREAREKAEKEEAEAGITDDMIRAMDLETYEKTFTEDGTPRDPKRKYIGSGRRNPYEGDVLGASGLGPMDLSAWR